jgi:hypothetical protein
MSNVITHPVTARREAFKAAVNQVASAYIQTRDPTDLWLPPVSPYDGGAQGIVEAQRLILQLHATIDRAALLNTTPTNEDLRAWREQIECASDALTEAWAMLVPHELGAGLPETDRPAEYFR